MELSDLDKRTVRFMVRPLLQIKQSLEDIPFGEIYVGLYAKSGSDWIQDGNDAFLSFNADDEISANISLERDYSDEYWNALSAYAEKLMISREGVSSRYPPHWLSRILVSVDGLEISPRGDRGFKLGIEKSAISWKLLSLDKKRRDRVLKMDRIEYVDVKTWGRILNEAVALVPGLLQRIKIETAFASG